MKHYPSVHRGTDLLHSFEACGVDSFVVQLKTREDGKGSGSPSSSVVGEAICSNLERIAPTLSKTITHAPSYAYAAQLQDFPNSIVSSTPKHNLVEIKLLNF